MAALEEGTMPPPDARVKEADAEPQPLTGRKRSAGEEFPATLMRKRSKGSFGDADLTESESEADSLFQEAGPVQEPKEEPTAEPEEKPGSLTRVQLLQRRLDHTQRLRQLYLEEYWALLEEYRARYKHVLSKATQEGETTPEQPDAGAADEMVPPPYVSMRELIRQTPAPSVSDLPLDSNFQAPQPTLLPDALPNAPTGSTHASEEPSPEAAAVKDEERPVADVKPEVASEDQPPDASVANPQQDSEPGAKGQEDGLGVVDFEHAKAAVFGADPSWPAATPQQLSLWRAAFKSRIPEISRLEQAAAAAVARELDKETAMAVLLSHAVQYTIRRSATSLGRNTGSCGQVDIDLALAGCAKRVSRQQATLTLHPDGRFTMRNIGRRSFFVNSTQVNQGQVATLVHLSHIDIGGLQLLFLVNHLAVKRAMARTQQHSVVVH